MYLKHKDRTVMTSTEAYLAEKYLTTSIDFFPIKRAIALNNVNSNDEAGGIDNQVAAMAQAISKIESRFAQLEGMQ
jgi:hypothetical protein